MRIAQVAPLVESCPPTGYGGIERVVSFLTEELVAMGHDVTLFAAGDLNTSARLVAACPRALRLNPEKPDPIAWQMIMLEQVALRAANFDVIHFHIDFLHLPLFSRLHHKTVTTLHGRLDLPHLPVLFRAYPQMPVVSISHAQRRPLPEANWAANIYHGLPERLYRLGPGDGGYLLFLGRITPEKGVEDAIAIAKKAGLPLRIAAKVDVVDEDYFRQRVVPLLDEPLIEFLGEVNDARKQELLGRAMGLLFPIDWPEPFGLVMIEAMATGTPVIAYASGSVPEIVEEGRSGLIVQNVETAVEAVRRLPMLDRQRVRACFEARFAVRRMADAYLMVYRQMTLPTSEPSASVAA